LFATHRRESRSVASKGLRLHKNCAILPSAGERDWGRGEVMDVAADVSERRDTIETSDWQGEFTGPEGMLI
jgi:hypothetical protein